MKKVLTLIFVQLFCWSVGLAGTDDPTLSLIKKAMPAAPDGWTESGDAGTVGGAGRYRYVINYRRTTGAREDRNRLDAAYAESSRRNRDAAKPQIDELIRQQTATSIALRKAVRRRNAPEEKRLNEELEANGSRMQALHEEVDRRIAQDVQPYLLRDADAAITVAVNEEAAELPHAENIPVNGAAFALFRHGAPSGTYGWKQGELLVLYGDWRSLGNNVFRAQVPAGPDRSVRTIKITIAGEQARAEQLLHRIDLKAVLSLMK